MFLCKFQLKKREKQEKSVTFYLVNQLIINMQYRL